MYESLNIAFTLRVKLYRDEASIVVRVFDNLPQRQDGKFPLDCEVRQGGRTIFPRGSFVIGLPPIHGTDSADAKRAVLSWLSVKPGDTDREFFESYTDDQIDFVIRNGEALSLEAERRYSRD